MKDLFFHSWRSILHVALSAALIYLLVIVALRVVGERALARMSAYDLIVTVALGSLVAAIPLTENITIADGVVAIVTFLALQELTRFLQARSMKIHRIVRKQPQLLLWDGELLFDRLKANSITEYEVFSAIRRAGIISVSQVQAAVLENDGEWSVIGRGRPPDMSAMEGLELPAPQWPGTSNSRDRGSDKNVQATNPPSSVV